MARRRTLRVNSYDYPHYYDIAFQGYTRMEADFIEAACRKYCGRRVRRLLEPACGTGRLITELAARGYDMIGFDLNQAALSYLRQRLRRRRLNAEVFEADMTQFQLDRRIEAAFCTVNTFRHLLTEQAARRHLECIAATLRPGGIYLLGMHLQRRNSEKLQILPWEQRRGATAVLATLRPLSSDWRRRFQKFRVDLLVRTRAEQLRLRHEFPMRTYTPRQFRDLLKSVPSLELWATYNSHSNIEKPVALNDAFAYSLFVLRRQSPS